MEKKASWRAMGVPFHSKRSRERKRVRASAWKNALRKKTAEEPRPFFGVPSQSHSAASHSAVPGLSESRAAQCDYSAFFKLLARAPSSLAAARLLAVLGDNADVT